MGIYSTKFALESAVDNTVQTPDDIGVDLDQVEKNIVGEDGIEAHADEVNASVEGLVGDPLEEAYMVMYESQYNYNQIMNTIGMTELAEMSAGRDYVMEAADSKGFFAKIKELLTSMFERITGAFKKVASALYANITNDKKFVNDFKAKIEAGAATDWSAKGWVFPKDITFKAYNGMDYMTGLNIKLKTLKADGAVELDPIDVARANVIKNRTGINADTIDAMNEALSEQLHGGKEKVELKGKVTAAEVINILKNDAESKAVKKSYDELKDSYKKAIGEVAKIEKAINSADYPSMSRAMTVCERYTALLTFEKNVQNNVYVMTLRAAREKRAQARKLAHLFAAAAPAVQHNSATMGNNGSVFSGVKFI